MDDTTLLEAEAYSQSHVVFWESPCAPSPVPISDSAAPSPPSSAPSFEDACLIAPLPSPPETFEERQFQEALDSVTPPEACAYEAAPPFHTAPLVSHTIHIRISE